MTRLDIFFKIISELGSRSKDWHYEHAYSYRDVEVEHDAGAYIH